MSYYEIRNTKNKRPSLFDAVVNKVVGAFVDRDKEKIDLKLRYVDILRGEEYVNDIRDILIDKYSEASKFELVDLIYLLYVDFIRQIKNGKYSHKDAAIFLLDGKRKYLDTLNKPKFTRKEVHQVTPNTFIFEEIEEDEEEEFDEEISIGDLVLFETAFNIRDNNRCKVFLYDIEQYLEGEVLTVQDIIRIRYLNFIDQVRLEGNNSKVMNAIMKNFINEKSLE